MQDASGGTTATRLPRLAILQLRGLEHFLPDLAAGLAASGVVEVQVFTIRSPADLQDALDWTDRPATDAVWFEFCWPPFPDLIARTDFAGRRVIVRVHRIEAYETPHVARCPWPKVDDLVTVSQDMARLVREAAPQLERTTRLRVIHNGVQLGRFAPAEAPPDPFRIGWCGTMIARKNPTLALEVLARLLAEDPRWRLHVVAGQGDRLTQDAVLHLVPRMRLGGAVRYDGALPAAEMPAWHARNAVLLSTSLHESFGYAIAEAAAVGCDLAVLEHRGVEEFWPEAVRFATADEAVRLIRDARPQRWRGLVEARFGLDRQVAAVLALLCDRPAAGLPGGALPGPGACNPEPRHSGTREPDPGQAEPASPRQGQVSRTSPRPRPSRHRRRPPRRRRRPASPPPATGNSATGTAPPPAPGRMASSRPSRRPSSTASRA